MELRESNISDLNTCRCVSLGWASVMYPITDVGVLCIDGILEPITPLALLIPDCYISNIAVSPVDTAVC